MRMSTVWRLLLCIVLFAWWPVGFATEVSVTLPSLGMRGAPGAIELIAHAAVAALSIAACRAVWSEAPAARPLAASALVASALASVQSLYWSVLPHQTKPGDELPLAILAVAHAGAWCLYLNRSAKGQLGVD
jgi:hypothetical protein